MRTLLSNYAAILVHSIGAFVVAGFFAIVFKGFPVSALVSSEVLSAILVVTIFLLFSFSIFYAIFKNKNFNKKLLIIFIYSFIFLYSFFVVVFYKDFMNNLFPFQMIGLLYVIIFHLLIFRTKN